MSRSRLSDHPHARVDVKSRADLLEATRSQFVAAAPAQVFQVFLKLGGEQRWPAWDSLWRIRGVIDRLVGGPGMRPARSDQTMLKPGDVIDYFRVETVQPPSVLRLHAEMRLPGSGWLEFSATPEGSGTRIRQTAYFSPSGIPGLIYWYAMYPAHVIVFRDMVRAIAKLALAESAETSVSRRISASGN